MTTIGIPRAFLFERYRHLWEAYFEALGIDYLISPPTDKSILDLGMRYAIDEACLSSKVYLGHVAWLVDRCDRILVPRIFGFGQAGSVCTKFQAIYDLVRNTFREKDPPLLHYNIETRYMEGEMRAFLTMGRALGKKKTQTMAAYLIGKQAEKTARQIEEHEQNKKLEEEGMKLLIVAHKYNAFDALIGQPVTDYLHSLKVITLHAGRANRKEALAHADTISETLPWLFNRELIGAISLYKDRIDGIVLLSTFPCGPDSLVNEVILRRVKELPVLNLVLDGQEARTGIETRLESFVDIIMFRKGELY